MLAELRYAIRTLAKNPGFSVVAILTLALGTGGNTALFSVVDSVLLRPLPFKDAERLVLVTGSPEAGLAHTPLSYPEFSHLREHAQSFEAIAAWSSFTDTRFLVTGSGEPEDAQYALVSASFFQAMGVQPAAGRVFADAEDRPGPTRPVVVTRGFWDRRFGAETAFTERTVILDGEPFQVVGVLPRGFRFVTFPKEAAVFVPLSLDPVRGRRYSPAARYLGVVARLKPEASIARAQSEQPAIVAALAAQHPGFYKNRTFDVTALSEQVTGHLRRAILALWGAVGFVLLIACANIASLLLARTQARSRELAIRSALGAGRLRVIRPIVAETLVIAAAGGGIGVLLGVWAVDLVGFVARAAPDPFIPYEFDPAAFTISGRTLAVTTITALLSALCASLLPAVAVLRSDLGQPLRPAGSATGADRSRVRGLLVIGELAMSVVLLVGAGLMAKSLWRLQHVEPGFQAQSVLTMDVPLTRSAYADREAVGQFYDAVTEQVAALPTVSAVGITDVLPLTGTDGSTGFFVDGRPMPSPDETPDAHHRAVTPGYFGAMRIPMVHGRPFTARDTAHSPRVAIINETMARQFWPRENPIGRRVALNFEAWRYYPDGPPQFDLAAGMREIVGIVGDVRHSSLSAQPVPELYVPHTQMAARQTTLVVRTTGDPMLVADGVRRELRRLNHNAVVTNVRTLTDLVDLSLGPSRLNARLAGVFSIAAVVLALVGLYGVLAYFVVQRRREIGVRLALGATRGDVVRLVLRQATRLIAAGLAIGALAAAGMTRTIGALLFEVSPTDPLTFVSTGGLLGMVALLACYLPARRAARLDPVVALRYD